MPGTGYIEPRTCRWVVRADSDVAGGVDHERRSCRKCAASAVEELEFVAVSGIEFQTIFCELDMVRVLSHQAKRWRIRTRWRVPGAEQDIRIVVEVLH